MNIVITENASKVLTEKINDHKGHLKLKYDTEGCGCVVSGVPILWYVENPDEVDDIEIETNFRPILVEKSKMVFLDEELKIDYSLDSNTFRLVSPAQIINGRMGFKLYPEE
ncbi:uncharacterized protein YqkB [Bacillus pakistanensis]|uniref:Uncharacterized protein YqkB n=1 Tax=Rossellomorea pakistanensis TaxID=992288 RepID=A0ABS2N9C7_9BACI|nr:iron-sulfur cluster biosynthesis family protein [Bacillus pakistanensis]MBM7584440.1 uncharacterized protein YqkB [Bacillus pakistanensis]